MNLNLNFGKSRDQYWKNQEIEKRIKNVEICVFFLYNCDF